MRPPRKTVPLLLLLLYAGCSEITGPPSLLQQFNWEPITNPEIVEPGIDASTGLGDVFVLGQLVTPSQCHDLRPEFEQDGTTLTLRVEARETNPTTCAEGPGAFRYTAVIRNLDRDTYQLRVRHVVDGEVNEYTDTLET